MPREGFPRKPLENRLTPLRSVGIGHHSARRAHFDLSAANANLEARLRVIDADAVVVNEVPAEKSAGEGERVTGESTR